LIHDVRNTTESVTANRDASDLQRTAESLVEACPDLADPAKLRLFNEVLNRHIAMFNLAQATSTTRARRQISKTEQDAAKKLTSFATAVSGAVSLGAIAALIAPAAPGLAILCVALVGLLGSNSVARSVDKLMERNQRGSSHSSL